jgi:hypothetical protein
VSNLVLLVLLGLVQVPSYRNQVQALVQVLVPK